MILIFRPIDDATVSIFFFFSVSKVLVIGQNYVAPGATYSKFYFFF